MQISTRAIFRKYSRVFKVDSNSLKLILMPIDKSRVEEESTYVWNVVLQRERKDGRKKKRNRQEGKVDFGEAVAHTSCRDSGLIQSASEIKERG